MSSRSNTPRNFPRSSTEADEQARSDEFADSLLHVFATHPEAVAVFLDDQLVAANRRFCLLHRCSEVATAARHPEQHSPKGGKERILCVDDEAPITTLTQKILEKLALRPHLLHRPAHVTIMLAAMPVRSGSGKFLHKGQHLPGDSTPMDIDPDFKQHILYLDLVAIENSEDVVYIVDDHLVLRAYNGSWEKFALENGGDEVLARYPLGVTVTDAFRQPLKDYLTRAYKEALRTNTPFEQNYECPSPEEYRLYRQTAYPLVHGRGLVITNHLTRRADHRHDGVAFTSQFVDDRGVITQCQNCRRIRHPGKKESWLWVPSLVKNRLANISHGICPYCLDHYYPDIEE